MWLADVWQRLETAAATVSSLKTGVIVAKMQNGRDVARSLSLPFVLVMMVQVSSCDPERAEPNRTNRAELPSFAGLCLGPLRWARLS